MGVIGKLDNEEFLICIFTVKVQYGTPNICTNKQYNNWFQQSRYQFSPVIMNTTCDNVNLSNQVKAEIPRRSRVDPKTVNNHEFCYQHSIDDSDLIFVNLSIRDKINEPPPRLKKITTNEKFYMRTIFIKIQKNKFEETNRYYKCSNNCENSCRVTLPENLWIPFLYQLPYNP